jgi:hypothetical protein
MEKGDEALECIKEVDTDIAERLPNVPFVNYVDFDPQANDFISKKDKVSMVEMTDNNLRILQLESMYDGNLVPEYERAKVEVEEVKKLVEWFKSARVGSYLLFESLPIGKQKVAVTRIYQKGTDGCLKGCFLSLYNSNINRLNGLRRKIGVAGHDDLASELDILKNGYQFYDERLIDASEFVDFYVDAYDELMLEQSGKTHRFGIQVNNASRVENGIEKVQSHPELVANYISVLTAMRDSDGTFSQDLFDICKKFGIGKNLLVGQEMKTPTYRLILKDLIRYMTSTIDRGETVSGGSDGASGVGQSYEYESLACAEIDIGLRSNGAESGSVGSYNRLTSFEQKAVLWAYGVFEDLPNFGIPKIDRCKTKNCPSHKEIKVCVVGGCGFCKDCHKILKNGDPERFYAKQEAEREKEKKKIRTAEYKKKAEMEYMERQERLEADNKRKEQDRARFERKLRIVKHKQAASDISWSGKAA